MTSIRDQNGAEKKQSEDNVTVDHVLEETNPTWNINDGRKKQYFMGKDTSDFTAHVTNRNDCYNSRVASRNRSCTSNEVIGISYCIVISWSFVTIGVKQSQLQRLQWERATSMNTSTSRVTKYHMAIYTGKARYHHFFRQRPVPVFM